MAEHVCANEAAPFETEEMLVRPAENAPRWRGPSSHPAPPSNRLRNAAMVS
jgi:hypothetical protein